MVDVRDINLKTLTLVKKKSNITSNHKINTSIGTSKYYFKA